MGRALSFLLMVTVVSCAAPVASGGPSISDPPTALGFRIDAACRWLDLTRRSDGGYGYRPGGEPFLDATAWAVVALSGGSPSGFARSPTTRRRNPGIDLAISFIRSCRRGKGYASHPADPEPSWMSAPAMLALAVADPEGTEWSGGAAWLLGEDRAQQEPGRSAPGWPWTAGCAPWVEPTAITAMCLGLVGRSSEQRVSEGLAMIQHNQARGGGWSLYEKRAYPYHTGLVILAHVACGWRPDGPGRFDLDPARRFLAGALERSHSPLDLAVGSFALAALGGAAAPVAVSRLVAFARADGSFGGTLETAFGILAMRQLARIRPLIGPWGPR
jgi:hypothetical protein